MIIFVLPAYNEEHSISFLVEEIDSRMSRKKLQYHLCIVNDGSTDKTYEILIKLKEKYPLTLFSHYPNRGVGETFQEGFKAALQIGHEDDIVVTMEADNTSDLDILDQMLLKLNEGTDVVLASCYAPQGSVVGTTSLRVFLSKAANLLLQIFFPLKNIHTYSSFYRVYRISALQKMVGLYGKRFFEEPGFECMVELLIKLARHSEIKISEVSMVLDGSKRVGKSKMRILRTICGFLRVILKHGLLGRFRNPCPKQMT